MIKIFAFICALLVVVSGINQYNKWSTMAAYAATLSLLDEKANMDVKRYMESIPCVFIVRANDDKRTLNGELTCAGVFDSSPLLIPSSEFVPRAYEKFVSYSAYGSFAITSLDHRFKRTDQ